MYVLLSFDAHASFLIFSTQFRIIQSLQNRFKERRRVRKFRALVSSPTIFKSPTQKQPVIQKFGVPAIPPGEDNESFERHNGALKTEFSRPTPNASNIKQLMEVTDGSYFPYENVHWTHKRLSSLYQISVFTGPRSCT